MTPIVNQAVRRLQEDPSWRHMTGAEKKDAAGLVLRELGSGDPLDVFEAIAAMDAKVEVKPTVGRIEPMADNVDRPARVKRPKAGVPQSRMRGNTRNSKKRPKQGPTLVEGPIDPYTQDSYLRRVKVCTGMTDEELAQIIGKSRFMVVNYVHSRRKEYLDRKAVEALHRTLAKYQEGITALMADLEERLRLAAE